MLWRGACVLSQVRTTGAEDDDSRLHNSTMPYKIANAVIVVKQLPKRWNYTQPPLGAARSCKASFAPALLPPR